MTNSHATNFGSGYTSAGPWPVQQSLCSCGGRRRARRGTGCVTVRDVPIDRPDLATYSQTAALADHVVPTWNNPSIQTHDWPGHRVRREVSVRIHNLSATTAALNGLLHLYTAAFGIGTSRQLRLSRVVNLGPRAELDVTFPMPEEAFPGGGSAGAIHVRLEHPYDSDPINNAGSKVVDAVDTGSGRRQFGVEIPVVNNFSSARELQLSVLPTDLASSLSPHRHHFAPFEQIMAMLHIEAPIDFTGTPDAPLLKEATVMVRVADTGEVIGGATVLVRIVT